MEDICKNCANYKSGNTYLGTGYCTMHDDFTKCGDSCPDYTEED